VVVDLAHPSPDGSPGEDDVLTGIEDATGTDAGDRLYGDDGRNRLDGKGGVDLVEGRGGDDVIRPGGGYQRSGERPAEPERASGGPGDDDVSGGGVFNYAIVSGGPGDDVVRPARRGGIFCGEGADLLAGSRLTPAVGPSCERWSMRVAGTPEDPVSATFPYPRRSGGAVRLNVPCPRTEPAPCEVVLRVTTPAGTLLGAARAVIQSGARRTLAARLSAAGRHGRVKASVALSLRREGDFRPRRGGVVATLS
jgi:hypothetical protein